MAKLQRVARRWQQSLSAIHYEVKHSTPYAVAYRLNRSRDPHYNDEFS